MKVAAPTEKAFQAQVLTLARLWGWRCYHAHASRRSAPGFPDLVMVRPEQRGWLDALDRCKGIEARLWRPRDWPEIEEVLKR